MSENKPVLVASQRASLLLLGGAGAIILGAFLAWATVGPFSVAGTSGDGKLTVVGGGFVAWIGWRARAGTARRGHAIAALILSLLVLAVGASDTADISSKSRGVFHAEVGIGLWLTDIGAVVAVVGAGMWLFRRARPPTSF